MKFVSSSLLAAGLLLGAGAAYAGSDDGTADNQSFQPVLSQAPAPAPAAAQQQAEIYSRFEHQVVQP